MKITMIVEYDDTQISANLIGDRILELEGVEGVEVGDWL